MCLDDLRRRIDVIDDGIIALLNERARVIAGIARAKREAALPTYDPHRERRVVERLTARAESFPAEAILAVYREIIGACRALQR
jgi:chorismate mutase/prephenate dehydratase